MRTALQSRPPAWPAADRKFAGAGLRQRAGPPPYHGQAAIAARTPMQDTSSRPAVYAHRPRRNWDALATFGRQLRETFQHWNAVKAPRLGAALAYYTVFSLAPLL